MRLEGDDKKI